MILNVTFSKNSYLPLLQDVTLKMKLHHEETGLYSQKKDKDKKGP